jgi:hypothetical protein
MLNVEKGEKSARVVALQILLNRDPAIRPRLVTDGSFGAKTVAAVNTFRERVMRQSGPSGVADPPTSPQRGVDRHEDDGLGWLGRPRGILRDPRHGRYLRSRNGQLGSHDDDRRPVGPPRSHGGLDGFKNDRMGRHESHESMAGGRRRLRPFERLVDTDKRGGSAVRAPGPHCRLDGFEDDRVGRIDQL